MGEGVPFKALEDLVARVRDRLPNLPDVVVLEAPWQAPKALREYIVEQGAVSDVEGASHNGKLYLFASGLSDMTRAEFVLAEHEATHYGLAAVFGPKLPALMNKVYNTNGAVRWAATALQVRGRFGENLGSLSDGYPHF
ncbi:MAG: hypothetical protein ACK4FF_05120 [Limnobacter sp.]|uniref:hypothetical protein n=1 Tax=Limnobacter sp. TaxID=2003368 RepID=UPI00391D2D80